MSHSGDNCRATWSLLCVFQRNFIILSKFSSLYHSGPSLRGGSPVLRWLHTLALIRPRLNFKQNHVQLGSVSAFLGNFISCKFVFKMQKQLKKQKLFGRKPTWGTVRNFSDILNLILWKSWLLLWLEERINMKS